MIFISVSRSSVNQCTDIHHITSFQSYFILSIYLFAYVRILILFTDFRQAVAAGEAQAMSSARNQNRYNRHDAAVRTANNDCHHILCFIVLFDCHHILCFIVLFDCHYILCFIAFPLSYFTLTHVLFYFLYTRHIRLIISFEAFIHYLDVIFYNCFIEHIYR